MNSVLLYASFAKNSLEAKTMKILVLSGPNLGRLGRRQPEVYGRETLADVHARLAEKAGEGVSIEGRQSNSEGELVGWVDLH